MYFSGRPGIFQKNKNRFLCQKQFFLGSPARFSGFLKKSHVFSGNFQIFKKMPCIFSKNPGIWPPKIHDIFWFFDFYENAAQPRFSFFPRFNFSPGKKEWVHMLKLHSGVVWRRHPATRILDFVLGPFSGWHWSGPHVVDSMHLNGTPGGFGVAMKWIGGCGTCSHGVW